MNPWEHSATLIMKQDCFRQVAMRHQDAVFSRLVVKVPRRQSE